MSDFALKGRMNLFCTFFLFLQISLFFDVQFEFRFLFGIFFVEIFVYVFICACFYIRFYSAFCCAWYFFVYCVIIISVCLWERGSFDKYFFSK